MGVGFWLQMWLLSITETIRSQNSRGLTRRTQDSVWHREEKQIYNFFHQRLSAGTCLPVTLKAMQRHVKAQEKPIATNEWEFKTQCQDTIHLGTQHRQVSMAGHFRMSVERDG